MDIIQNLDQNLEEDTTAHLMSTTGPWSPHSRLSSTNVSLMDPPRDGNHLFQAIYEINNDLLPLPLLIYNNDNNTDADFGPMHDDSPLEAIQQDPLDIIQNLDHNLQLHEETTALLMSTICPWSPHSRLSSTNVSIMDPPRNGNCLF